MIRKYVLKSLTLTLPCRFAMTTARIGIVTVSDRASRGEYEDKGGPAIIEYFLEVLSSPWEPVARVISDDQTLIEETLMDLVDLQGCCLVVTTGGTGPAVRDVTPEAAMRVIDRPHPGLMELARLRCYAKTPRTFLSRGVAGAEAMGDAYFGFYLLAMGRGRPRTAERLGEMLEAAGFEQVRRLPGRLPIQAGVISARCRRA